MPSSPASASCGKGRCCGQWKAEREEHPDDGETTKSGRDLHRTRRRLIDRQDLRDDLGKRLREAREGRNIGLRELARRLGVSPSLISQIETGKSEPSINTLFAIVGELELPVNEIVFDPQRSSGRSVRDHGRQGWGRDG